MRAWTRARTPGTMSSPTPAAASECEVDTKPRLVLVNEAAGTSFRLEQP
jgi:hypothetical protein